MSVTSSLREMFCSDSPLSRGGIAGLMFAYTLSKRSKEIQIDVYEASSNANEFGAEINLKPRVFGVLLVFLGCDLDKTALVEDVWA